MSRDDMKQIRGMVWFAICLIALYFFASLFEGNGREIERTRILSACQTDLECKVITDILKRVKE